jgi:tripartite-type tricarboxylate transporter receptor subunit TctC
MVLPFAAGGATDAIGRTLAQRMGEGLRQQIVVENRAGAGGAIAAAGFARTPPDGYTVLLATVSTLVVLPVTRVNPGYDVAKDFASIGLVAKAPNLLLASPKLPVNSVAELIAYAKANPGKLNFASSGHGTVTHLIGELFKQQAGIDVVHVPYKTGVQAFTEFIEGTVHFSFDSIVWSLPHVKAGTLRGLGISSSTRSALAPEMPTVAETGLPGFEGITWYGLMAPAGTPEPVLARLRQELKAALDDAAVIAKVRSLGAEATFGEPAELDALTRKDTAKWGKIVKDIGMELK